MIELLDDFGNDRKKDFSRYAIASKNKRFANYIIDLLVYLLLSFLTGIVIAIVMISLDKETEYIAWTGSSNRLADWLFSAILIVLYYTVCEFFFKGKTIGKLFTKTRAVRTDGKAMDLPTSLSRSFIRIIPFEQFSFLGDGDDGWHDKWSETMVIDESKPLEI